MLEKRKGQRDIAFLKVFTGTTLTSLTKMSIIILPFGQLRLQFCQINFGIHLKKEMKMCESCGCTPGEEPIEGEVCSGCGKPTAECICEPEEK